MGTFDMGPDRRVHKQSMHRTHLFWTAVESGTGAWGRAKRSTPILNSPAALIQCGLDALPGLMLKVSLSFVGQLLPDNGTLRSRVQRTLNVGTF